MEREAFRHFASMQLRLRDIEITTELLEAITDMLVLSRSAMIDNIEVDLKKIFYSYKNNVRN